MRIRKREVRCKKECKEYVRKERGKKVEKEEEEGEGGKRCKQGKKKQVKWRKI